MVELTNTQLTVLVNFLVEFLSELNDIIVQIRNFLGVFNHLSFHSIPESCNKKAKMLARFVGEIIQSTR